MLFVTDNDFKHFILMKTLIFTKVQQLCKTVIKCLSIYWNQVFKWKIQLLKQILQYVFSLHSKFIKRREDVPNKCPYTVICGRYIGLINNKTLLYMYLFIYLFNSKIKHNNISLKFPFNHDHNIHSEDLSVIQSSLLSHHCLLPKQIVWSK